MREDWLRKYDLRLPRYTSYPTAPHFSPAVGGERYGEWLAGLDPATPLSLYVHIVYCAELCYFCGCHMRITKRYAPVADYLEAVLAEVDLVADRTPGVMPARHLHFGGGTPSILTPEDFERTIARFRDRFAFAAEAEIAIELDPRTATPAYVAALSRSGVNRVSLGVQDFNPEVQEAVNRIQPEAMVARLMDDLRGAGITEINMDLIYGLPRQTVASVIDTIDRAVALRPRRVSLFGYAHVPWMRKHQTLIPDEILPDLKERWAQYDAACARFAEHGYVAVGLDHFAAPDDAMALALRRGDLHRNFQGYTTDAAPVLLGFGASGIGALPQGYVVNEGEIHAYKRLIRDGRLATKRGIAIGPDDRLRAAVIERLMCDMRVDLDRIAALHGVDAASAFAEELEGMGDFAADGIIELDGRTIRVTEPGRPLVRAVAARFDRYLRPGEQRHSKAV